MMQHRLRKNREEVEELETCFPLSPILDRAKAWLSPEYYFGCYVITSRQMKIYTYGIRKKDAIIFLDDVFWQHNLETTQPKIKNGELRATYEDKRNLVSLGVELGLTEGDGCRKVFKGYKKVEEYEWICDDTDTKA